MVNLYNPLYVILPVWHENFKSFYGLEFPTAVQIIMIMIEPQETHNNQSTSVPYWWEYTVIL